MRLDDLDRRLAGLAAEGARQARPPAPATIRCRSRHRRYGQTVGAVLLAGALTAGVAAGCATWPVPPPPTGPMPALTTGPPAPDADAVPWIPAPARPDPTRSQNPSAIPPGTPACTARQLRASASWEGATGSLAGAVTFTSRGAAACSLTGYPTIVLLDRNGHALQLTSGRFTTSYQAPRPVLVRPGVSPRADFHWANWCGANPGAIRMRVTLPRGGTLVPTIDTPTRNVTPRCDAPASPSTLSHGPFLAERPEPPPDPLASLHVQATLPASAVAGQPLRYTVTLANPTTTAVSLRDCPSYEERVTLDNGGATSERHLLNCAPAAAIGPGQQVTFAMVLDLPATLGPGNGVLVWQLLREPPPSTKVPFTVIGP